MIAGQQWPVSFWTNGAISRNSMLGSGRSDWMIEGPRPYQPQPAEFSLKS